MNRPFVELVPTRQVRAGQAARVSSQGSAGAFTVPALPRPVIGNHGMGVSVMLSAADVPAVGHVVRLDGAASAEFARRPFRLLITEPPVPSTVDAAERRNAATARWLLLTGWELDTQGQKVRLWRAIPVRRAGLVINQQGARDPGPRKSQVERGSVSGGE